MTKPPLGIAPHWLAYNKRMYELTETIQKYLAFIAEKHATIDSKGYYRAVSMWAEEKNSIVLLEIELEDAK